MPNINWNDIIPSGINCAFPEYPTAIKTMKKPIKLIKEYFAAIYDFPSATIYPDIKLNGRSNAAILNRLNCPIAE